MPQGRNAVDDVVRQEAKMNKVFNNSKVQKAFEELDNVLDKKNINILDYFMHQSENKDL